MKRLFHPVYKVSQEHIFWLIKILDGAKIRLALGVGKKCIMWPGMELYYEQLSYGLVAPLFSLMKYYCVDTETHHQNKSVQSCGEKREREKAQTSRSPKLMVHLSLSEPLTGSALSRGKTRVKRWEVSSGVTAYISLALQPLCPLLYPEVQQSNV